MKRNLIYYIYPRQCSMLALNLYLLCKYQKAFNGKRIFVMAEEEGLVDKTHIGWMLNDTHQITPYELYVAPKDEPYLVKMLEMVQSTDSEEITFFGHTNGTEADVFSKHNTTLEELSAWTEAIYRNNLSHPDKIESILKAHPCAGTFKYTVEQGTIQAPWSYAGGFFWINHQQFFTTGWKEQKGVQSIMECLGNRFSYDQAYNFGGKHFQEILNPYDSKDLSKFYRVVKNWDPSRITVVTTCKNRWEFLSKSLESWINRGFKEIIVVDWSSDIPVTFHIEQMPSGPNSIMVLRVEGENIFNAGMARNTGARYVKSDYIMFIDADMVIKDWSLANTISMVPGRFYHGPHNIPPFGTSLIRKKDFDAVNGYTELYTAYGWEDNDLYNRLEAIGLRRCFYDERMVEHTEHSDELRAQYRDQRGRKLHETVWDNKKLEPWTMNHKRAKKPLSIQRFKVL